ncbi:hypothetical protein J3F83DRAFT_55890 [Trichoderma novae-zelandiae]
MQIFFSLCGFRADVQHGFIVNTISPSVFRLLRATGQACAHNESIKKDKIKNSASNGPEGQLSAGRLRDVQCRPPTLVPRILDLGALKQGKYEEKKRRKRRLKMAASGRWFYRASRGPCAYCSTAAAWGAAECLRQKRRQRISAGSLRLSNASCKRRAAGETGKETVRQTQEIASHLSLCFVGRNEAARCSNRASWHRFTRLIERQGDDYSYSDL